MKTAGAMMVGSGVFGMGFLLAQQPTAMQVIGFVCISIVAAGASIFTIALAP